MYSFMNAWLQFFNLLFIKEERHEFLKSDVIHYHVRREIAKRIFNSDYDRLGRFIQVTNEQYKELVKIERDENYNINKERDDELVTKIKEVIKINKDAVD